MITKNLLKTDQHFLYELNNFIRKMRSQSQHISSQGIFVVDVSGGGLGFGFLPRKVSCMIFVTKEISMVIDIIDSIDINKWLISECYRTSHYELLTN